MLSLLQKSTEETNELSIFYKNLLTYAPLYQFLLFLFLFNFLNPLSPLTPTFYLQFFLFFFSIWLVNNWISLRLRKEIKKHITTSPWINKKPSRYFISREIKNSFLIASTWFLFLPAAHLLLDSFSYRLSTLILLLLLFLKSFLQRISKKYRLPKSLLALFIVKNLILLLFLLSSPLLFLLSLI